MRKRFTLSLCLLFVSATLVFGQVLPKESLKTVYISRTLPNAPVTIIRVLYQGKQVEPGMPFEAGDNWLRGVSVVLKNVSPSDVVLINIFGDVPETGAGTTGSPRVPVANGVGRKPEVAMYSPLTGQRKSEDASEPINLEPGKELTIPLLSKEYYEDFDSLVTAKQPLSSITKCEISVATVYFSDGTKWAHGYWEPDASTPGRYKPISSDDWQGKHKVR